MKLYLDTTNGRLVTSTSDATPLGSLPIHQGDIGEVELVLLEASSNLASPFEVITLPAGFSRIKLGARLATDLMADELLFSATEWELSGGVYVAPLNRETSGITAAFPDANLTLRSVEALMDIQFASEDLSVKETPLKQWPVTVTRDIVRDTEGVPTTGNPLLYSLEVETTIKAGSLAAGRPGAAEGSMAICNGGGTTVSPHVTVQKTLATQEREIVWPDDWGTPVLQRGGNLRLPGSVSGTAEIKAPATGGGIATLPPGDVQLLGAAAPGLAGQVPRVNTPGTGLEFVAKPAMLVVANRANGTNQSIPHATWTTVLWPVEVSDPGNAYNPATGEFTAPRTGFYNFTASWFWAPVSSNINAALYVGGALRNILDQHFYAGGKLVRYVGVVSLAAGDILTIRALHDLGSPRNINGFGPTYNLLEIAEL